jgi:ABC-type branched-subunit amino acid transport system ATPase component
MLELRAISKTWRPARGAARSLLRDLHLTVAAGETVAVLGPSGSGKSTLLKIIAGLEPPDWGQVFLDGHDISGLPPHRRHCGLLFQDFALFPHLSVQDNVAFGLIEQGQRRTLARAQAIAMLQRFGLGAHTGAKVWQLSGGEQQRVALARALITAPRVLLLDEPFSALDADLRLGLRAEFQQRIAASGMAVLWVTHDEAEARSVGARGFRVVDGALQQLW